jgi:hypothetical protein
MAATGTPSVPEETHGQYSGTYRARHATLHPSHQPFPNKCSAERTTPRTLPRGSEVWIRSGANELKQHANQFDREGLREQRPPIAWAPYDRRAWLLGIWPCPG